MVVQTSWKSPEQTYLEETRAGKGLGQQEGQKPKQKGERVLNQRIVN